MINIWLPESESSGKKLATQDWGKHQITSQAFQWMITLFTTMQCKQATIMHLIIWIEYKSGHSLTNLGGSPSHATLTAQCTFACHQTYYLRFVLRTININTQQNLVASVQVSTVLL